MILVRRWPGFFSVLVLCLLAAVPTLAGDALGVPAGKVARPRVTTILLHDTLQPQSVTTLREELETANADRPAAIMLDLSTPGGEADSAEAMVRLIRASRAPVLVFAREPRTKVAGEGLRVLLAGKAAAMDPGTRLLPLEPLHHGSKMVQAERQREIDTLLQAVRNAMARRGRDPQEAFSLLSQDVPIAPEAAMAAGLLDAVTAKDDVALRSLWPDNPAAAAWMSSAKVTSTPLTPRQHLMRALMNPDLTVLLLTLGALLILLEINTPGTIVPGAAGVLLVLLSVYALLLMHLRWQGVLLLAISATMLCAEAQFARGSTYGVAAVVALTFGLRLLVRGPVPQLEVDWGTSIGAGLGFGGITAGLVLLGVRARRAKVRTGADAMVGWLAVAQTELRPTGEVLVRGELWRARLSAGNTFLPAGEAVKVQSTDGVTLEVAPMAQHLQELETATVA